MCPGRTAILALAILAASASMAACGRVSPESPDVDASAAEATQSDTSGGVIDRPLSPRNANYMIDARLDPANRAITGSEVVTWRNVTNRSTDELQFHLYWNAWKDTRSTFMRERALRGRQRARPPEDFSSLDVTSIKLLESAEWAPGRPAAQTAAPVDLTNQKRFILPDASNAASDAGDETVMALRLPRAVEPDETVTIELKWTARVPRTFARTGAIGNFFFIAQWFPKVGVLEAQGWNTHQFHAATEFFSDYGMYDVRLTVPQGWIVGATGVERERHDNSDGTTTHRYYQEDVHDFAWTTSPDYLDRIATVDAGNGATSTSGIRVRLLLQPEHRGQADRHFEAARAALRQFTEWFGPYPYGHLTIVDPAYQSGTGGMEYPTLVTAGTNWLVSPEVTINTPEEVTIHEIGHQWWYGIVGSNEFENAWMDEGLTTYAAARALGARYRPTYLERRYFGSFVPWAFSDIHLARETYWNRLAGYRISAKSDLPSTPSYQYSPATGTAITYNKTALWLNTMERWLGWPVMQRILSTYFERWRFKHPQPGDFFDIATEVTGRDLKGFFDQVYRTSNVFDYGVQALESGREGSRFRTNVTVRRYGEAIFPVDVRVTFEDGEQLTERWTGEDRWKLYTYERDSRAVSAQVDPDRVLLLDVNYTNNSRALDPQGPRTATRWALKWIVWLQDALLTWASLV